MRPIPRVALRQTITYRPDEGIDQYGNRSYGDAVTVSYVHAEPVSKIRLQAIGELPDYKLVVYYDMTNSVPDDITFSAGDLITHNGIEYTVSNVTPYEDRHYEVLCK